MSRPRFSTLAAAALVLVAVLLAATAALLNYSGEPHGDKIVVRVRFWAEPIAQAYRQSFEAFNRAHPGIEVRANMVAYPTYFDTLRTDGYELATMWVQAADDDLRAFLTSGGWEADGAHQEVAVDEEGRHLKLVRLHTDITPA